MSETYAEVATPHVWRDPKILWRITLICYFVAIALFVALALAEGYGLAIVSGWTTIDYRGAANLEETSVILSRVMFYGVTACIVLTLALTYRLVANAHAMMPKTKVTGALLSVSAYFIPLLNLFMPPLILAEVWRAAFGESGRQPNGLITLWWGALIISTITNAAAAYTSPESWMDPGQAIRPYALSTLSFVARSVSACTLLVIFGTIVGQQRTQSSAAALQETL